MFFLLFCILFFALEAEEYYRVDGVMDKRLFLNSSLSKSLNLQVSLVGFTDVPVGCITTATSLSPFQHIFSFSYCGSCPFVGPTKVDIS